MPQNTRVLLKAGTQKAVFAHGRALERKQLLADLLWMAVAAGMDRSWLPRHPLPSAS